jgi:hypothetical protein
MIKVAILMGSIAPGRKSETVALGYMEYIER